MRTITKNAHAKLGLQAKEAMAQANSANDQDKSKLLKIASILEQQTKECLTREDNSSYIYTHDQLENDVENILWKAAIRVSDYFGSNLDGLEANDIIEDFANNFINDLRIKLGNIHGIGPYEPSVPGEDHISIEVSENE